MKRGDGQSDFPPDEGKAGGTSSSRPEPQNNNGVPDDDPVLLETALRGDIKAFAELFENYRQRLYALCLKRLSDHSLAEDVVQEVFVRAFVSLPNYQHRNLFWQWLSTIAIRMCIDLQRRRSLTHYSEDIGATVDADSKRNGLDDQTGSALDTIIASERRAELFKSLGVLSKRQRRIFLLFALDSWSCADIAAAEGISLDAVHHLLFRARKKIRTAYQNGVPALVALPFAWLHGKVQRTADRIRMLLGVYGEGLSSACMQAACLGTVAMIVIATNHPTESLKSGDPIRSAEGVLSATQSQPRLTGSPKIASGNAPTQSQSAGDGAQSVQTYGSLINDAINPSENVTPEETWFSSIMASPNYESDHTILASGQYGSIKVLFSALFTSRDGGVSWKASSSRGLFGGEKLVFAPGYPQGERIFALGTEYYGLQQSDGGGELFRTVSPAVAGSLAISPLFGTGDSKILLGASTLLEYDAGTGITRPSSPFMPLSGSGGSSSITFSPAYATDRTIFVSDRYSKGKDLPDKGNHPFDSSHDQNTIYRCIESVCDEILLPFDATVTTMRLSPRFDQDGRAYAFADLYSGNKLLVSKNGGLTFQDIPLPIGNAWDFAVLWNTSSDPALFVSGFNQNLKEEPVVFRSLDGGRSWAGSRIEVPGFGWSSYVNKLIATPTGRLLAAGHGIACSEDLGLTWAPRCPPEP